MQRLTSSRLGTLALGGLAALVAGALLLIYIAQYRSDVAGQSETVSVLVAKQLIPQGTSGDLVASQQWYQVVEKPKADLEDGAITDPGAIRGQVAKQQIVPDQQLTADDFQAAPDNAVSYKLNSEERAISIPLDSAHALTPFLQPGDQVDVLGAFNVIPLGPDGQPVSSGAQTRPVLKTIASNVTVLDVPSSGSSATGGGDKGNVVVKVSIEQSQAIAFAIENGSVFLTARSQNGKAEAPPTLTTLETILLGVSPVKVYKSLGGR
jgi:pilus assembly protein CpaB